MKTKAMILCALIMLGLFNCEDSFLDTRPYGVVQFETFSQTRNGAELLLIGAYSLLDGFPACDGCYSYGAATSNWIYGSIMGGDAYKGSEEDDLPEINVVEIHNTPDTSPLPEAKWQLCYNGIQRANDAIRAFQLLKDNSEPDKKVRIAEARFLRAYFHYELYKVFRKASYIDETILDTRVINDPDILLEKIQEDLKSASNFLPLTQPEPGRITKGAAQSYLGITWMWISQFGSAKVMFDSVINSGRYSLNLTYHENFNADFTNSKESILEMQQSVNDGALGDNGGFNEILNHTYGGPGNCCGFHQPSQNLVNAFKTDDNGLPLLDSYNDSDVTSDLGLFSGDDFTPYAGNLDPRLDWTVGRRGIPYLDWGPHPGRLWIRKQPYGGPYSPVKNVYHKSQQNDATDNGQWFAGLNSNNNWRLFRYADLLLYAAEAEVELNNLETARKYVNMVRERAMNPAGFVMDGNVPAANYVIKKYNDSWSDKIYARKAVRFERRIELGMEGHRFFDLVRWGIAGEEKNKYFETESKKMPHLQGAVFEVGKDEYQPIPLKAIQLSYKNGEQTLEQNEGY